VGFLSRTAAVASADLRARLRRPAAAVLLVATAVAAWFAIPDPSPTSGLLQIGGARVLYTSPALAFATAAFLAFPLSLFGFYVASNALERDVRARIATVVAASPVRDAEYLLGKLIGNVVLLAAVSVGFMAAAMAMQVVRGEGPLEPGTYLLHYLVLCGPCVLWVAALALFFEAAPGLAGRIGEVAYFFVWAIGIPLSVVWKPGPLGDLGRNAVDFTGLGFLVGEVERIAGTAQFTLGYSEGDASRAPIVFPGLDFTPEALGRRALAGVAALLVAALAVLVFRRFDPARTQAAGARGSRSLLALANAVSRPLGRPLLAVLDRVAPDAALTFRIRPVLVLAALGGAIASAALPPDPVRLVVVPVMFGVMSVALADVATRERDAGVAAIVFSTPGGAGRPAPWKLATSATVALLLCGVPAARVVASEPVAGLQALTGTLFLSTAAVALGVATGTARTFMAGSLALWYLALNAKGVPAALDYGGWWAAATPATVGGWLLAAALAASLAVVAARARAAHER